jgi:hypothetical protein
VSPVAEGLEAAKACETGQTRQASDSHLRKYALPPLTAPDRSDHTTDVAIGGVHDWEK